MNMNEFKTPKLSKFINVQDDKTIIPESPLMTKLGFGTGVSVYRLKRSPKIGLYQSPWAIKKVLRNSPQKGIDLKCYAERLKDEADILKKLNHPNIVGFRAFVKAEDGRDCLAMEECDSSVGDLIEERVNEELGPFSVEKILKVALDVAKALDYLHRECHLLHGDIKSFNVLVKGDFEVIKLCDFGVSVPLNEDGVLDKAAGSHYVGTSCWLAPEALKNDGIIPVTNKADIFSFGLVLWEMMTLKIPNFDHSLDEDLSMLELSTTDADDEWLMHSETDLKYGTRPSLPEAELGDEYKPIIELFNLCTEEDINKRPSAEEIVEQLKALV